MADTTISSIPEYSGPSMGELFANHKLAETLIKCDHAERGNEILDAEEMARLRRFVSNPQQERNALMDELSIQDQPEPAKYYGSLVGYIAFQYGKESVVSEDEIARLREWFSERDAAGHGVA